MTITETHASAQSSLGQAILIWQRGGRIPMTLATALMADGYDVPSLERAYRK